MTTALSDPSLYTPRGVFYPRGQIFAMLPDFASAQAAADVASALPGVGAVQVVEGAAIVTQFGPRADEVGGAPSVGREDQFMLRFVELARQGLGGLLIDPDKADVAAIGEALNEQRAAVAYHYRALVIEELVDASPRAEAAAAGKL